jgi:fibronectin-binding autotransporter adhesin
MKLLSIALLECVVIFTLAASAAQATTVYWDVNGTATIGAGGPAATGAWNGTAINWNLDPNGGAAMGPVAAWVNGDTAIFSAGNDAAGEFTVTPSGTPEAAGIIFEEGTITLANNTNSTINVSTGTVELKAGTTLITANSGGTTNTGISFVSGGKYLISGNATLRTTNPGTGGSFVHSSAAIELANSANLTVDYQVNNSLNIIQSGTVISGTGSLTKAGAGVLAIASPSTYSGPTFVDDGELRIRNTSNRLPIATDVTVNSPGILNLNAVGQQIGSLSGNGRVGLAGATLTVNGTTGTTFSGTIEDTANAGANGNPALGGSVTKSGDGALTLTGANTYTGTTTISAGKLLANNTTGSATGSGPVSLDGGTLGGTGTVTGPITTTANGGTIAPGASAGTLTVTGDVTLGAMSRLAIELDGASSDSLAVGGTLDLTALDNFLDITVLNAGAGPWTIATYVTLVGVTFETISPGFSIDYGTGSDSQITLSATMVAALLGDFNSNGTVDAADYALWRKNEIPNTALPNDNGLLTQAARYDLWKANFGKSNPGSGKSLSQGLATVPEPTTLLLLSAAGLLTVRRGSRR